MNRLIAFKQKQDANIIKNGNFIDYVDPFYTNFTRSVGAANPLPSASTIFNPTSGTFNSAVIFSGATSYSRIIQNIPCVIGKTYTVRYNIIRHTNGANTINLIGISNSATLNVPNSVGIHSVNIVCEQANDDFGFVYNSGDPTFDIALGWIEVIETSPNDLDLFENEEVVLTKEIDDIRNIDSKNSGYSKTFSIPASKTNSKFFKHVYDLSDAGNWNPYAKAGAIFYSNGVEVFNGFMKLNDIVKKDNHSIYNITLFEEVADLKTTLENKTLANLGWNELQHEYTKTNIIASWNGNLALKNGGTTDAIKYPFCNWIGNFDDDSGNIHLLNFQDAFRPWVRAKYIFDKIFASTDFEYQSTFLNTEDFTKLFVDWNFGESFSMFGGNYSDFAEFRVDAEFYNDNTGTILGSSFTSPDFDSVQQVQAGQDSNSANDFFNTATETFTATEDNQTVYVYVDALMYGTAGNNLFCAIEHDSSVDGCLPNQYFSETNNVLGTSVLDNSGTQISWSSADWANIKRLTESVGTFTLNQGETITIKFKTNAGNTQRLGFATAMFSVQAGVDLDLTIVQNRTSIKQFDFIKSIVQMFNLIIVPNDVNPKFLTIEPAVNFYGSAGTLDWTNKIDIDEINIMPHDVSREYRFRMKDDSNDFNLNTYFENNNGKMYGEQIKTHNFEVISEETQVHENVLFSSTLYKNNMGGVFLPQIYGKKDGEFVQIDNNIRILYDVGIINCDSYSSETQNNESFSNQTTMLVFAPYKTYQPTIDDVQVDYGQSLSFTPGGNIPFNTLYYKYHFDIVKQLTEKESRIIKVKANLTSTDIINFKFSNSIFFENQLYRVNKIDYNTTKGELSVVELIRLSSNARFTDDKTHGDKICNLNLFAIALNGEVLMTDQAGAIQPASQSCCEEFGYTWYDAPIFKCNIKEGAFGHGIGHGNGVGHHNSSWSGGHSLVIGNKNSNGFGINTNNSLIVGNKNSAQSNTKNVAIVGEINRLGRDIKNAMIVGSKHQIDDRVSDFVVGEGIENVFVSGIGGKIKYKNTRVFGSNTTGRDTQLLQNTDCVYNGLVSTTSSTEIFLNNETNKRFQLPTLKAICIIEIDVFGIVCDSTSRDYGHYKSQRLYCTASGVGTNPVRMDNVDVISTHTNHGGSTSITVDLFNSQLRIVVNGHSRDATEWSAHCKIIEQTCTI